MFGLKRGGGEASRERTVDFLVSACVGRNGAAPRSYPGCAVRVVEFTTRMALRESVCRCCSQRRRGGAGGQRPTQTRDHQGIAAGCCAGPEDVPPRRFPRTWVN